MNKIILVHYVKLATMTRSRSKMYLASYIENVVNKYSDENILHYVIPFKEEGNTRIELLYPNSDGEKSIDEIQKILLLHKDKLDKFLTSNDSYIPTEIPKQISDKYEEIKIDESSTEDENLVYIPYTLKCETPVIAVNCSKKSWWQRFKNLWR